MDSSGTGYLGDLTGSWFSMIAALCFRQLRFKVNV